MTREEAIDYLQDAKSALPYKFGEAIDMAIEALKAPSGDLISRQWLLDVYGDYIGDNGEPKYYVPLEVVRQNIKDAPSADADVVRCKDCRHRYEEGDNTHYYWCRLNDRPIDNTDYFAWGERREP